MKNIEILQSDITKLDVDSIVNAANASLLGGGGVDGAIHRSAGPKLLAECRLLNGCETGEAKITKGYNLSAKHVIHTVGPVWHGGKNNEEVLLVNAYANSLRVATENGCKTVAFPNISTGVYGFPKDKAAVIALKTVKNFLKKHAEIDMVYFVCFDRENFDLYNSLR